MCAPVSVEHLRRDLVQQCLNFVNFVGGEFAQHAESISTTVIVLTMLELSHTHTLLVSAPPAQTSDMWDLTRSRSPELAPHEGLIVSLITLLLLVFVPLR